MSAILTGFQMLFSNRISRFSVGHGTQFFSLALGSVIAFFLTVGIHFFYKYVEISATPGMLDVEKFADGAITAAALFLGTFSGILSSIVLTNAAESTRHGSPFLETRAIAFSFFIAPVVIGGFYDKVSEINSFWVTLLLSYQNGYFWESVSSQVRRAYTR